MENQTDTKETEMPQAQESVSVDNNNLLANMFNSFLSQAGQNESNVVQDNGNEEEEDSDEEDSDDEDNDDDKWVALQKLLDSHLRITKCLLRMIKEK
jgi:hypothetical protein